MGLEGRGGIYIPQCPCNVGLIYLNTKNHSYGKNTYIFNVQRINCMDIYIISITMNQFIKHTLLYLSFH